MTDPDDFRGGQPPPFYGVNRAEKAPRLSNLLGGIPNDPVDHPSHYTSHPSGVECITIAEHFTFCVGNAIKYCWRAGLKDNGSGGPDANRNPVADRVQDLRKARWYLDREISRLERAL